VSAVVDDLLLRTLLLKFVDDDVACIVYLPVYHVVCLFIDATRC
jgi:hypothetical protein